MNKNWRILFICFFLIISLEACRNSKSEDSQKETDEFVGESESTPDSMLVIEGDTVKVTPSNKSEEPAKPKSNAYIVVDKPAMKLYVIEGKDTLFKGPIACGRNKGDKRGKDDGRTPEGDFKISKIHDSREWLYHTNSGRWVPHVYGPWFLRLDAKGWSGIGIHGTNAPGQIGQRRSKGCIRMHNEDIVKVHNLAFEGMVVKVLPDVLKSDPAGQNTDKKRKDDSKDGTKSQGLKPDTIVYEDILTEPEKGTESPAQQVKSEESSKSHLENKVSVEKDSVKNVI